MPGLYQIVNINYPLMRKTLRPPRVCDISPDIAAQIINFVGMDAGEIEHTVRAGEVWDKSAQAAHLAAVAEKAKG